MKFLSKDVQDAKARERFLREARAASSLSHPNICTIYAVDEYEGHPYIAMELLRGHTLRQILKEGPLQAPQILEIAIPITDALDLQKVETLRQRELPVHPGGLARVIEFQLAVDVNLNRGNYAAEGKRIGEDPHRRI